MIDNIGKEYGGGIINNCSLQNKELQKLLIVNYTDACKYLQEKYGIPKGNYFLKENCKSKNTKITRGKEGLFIHHIYEFSDNYPMINDLSKPNIAINYPFDYQLGENLCYCNYLEHLILHIKIWVMRSFQLNSINIEDGIIHHLIPVLNDIYNNNYGNHQPWHEKAIELIKQDINDYLNLLGLFATKSQIDISELKQLSSIMKICSISKELAYVNDDFGPTTRYRNKEGHMCYISCIYESCDVFSICCGSNVPLCVKDALPIK